MSTAWDPDQYQRFCAQRDRAALDLLSRLPDVEPAEIWDLGCGTGEHAAMMKRRWPQARVHGLDSSADMLDRARALPDAGEWIQGDAGAWAPERPADLILANASLQWLPNHEALFGRIADQLAPEGYYDALAGVCSDIDIWSTSYLQVLEGEDAVLEWMKGTALRPYLTALSGDLRDAFLSALSGRLSDAFPRRADGTTLMPFPRLFVIARR